VDECGLNGFVFRQRPIGRFGQTLLLFGVIEAPPSVLAADVAGNGVPYGGVYVFPRTFIELC